eukprot:jgi/Mesen1/2250/ME000153S01473
MIRAAVFAFRAAKGSRILVPNISRLERDPTFGGWLPRSAVFENTDMTRMVAPYHGSGWRPKNASDNKVGSAPSKRETPSLRKETSILDHFHARQDEMASEGKFEVVKDYPPSFEDDQLATTPEEKEGDKGGVRSKVKVKGKGKASGNGGGQPGSSRGGRNGKAANDESAEGGAAGTSVSGLVREGEGQAVWAMGLRVTVKVPGEATGGDYAVMEYHVAPGDGSQEHVHANEDEAWFMLDGQLEWRTKGQGQPASQPARKSEDRVKKEKLAKEQTKKDGNDRGTEGRQNDSQAGNERGPDRQAERQMETGIVRHADIQFQTKLHKADRGSFIHMPRNEPHSFHNASDKPAHMLVWCMPAGLERYFLEVGVPVSTDPDEKKPGVSEDEARQLSEAAKKYGLSYLKSVLGE